MPDTIQDGSILEPIENDFPDEDHEAFDGAMDEPTTGSASSEGDGYNAVYPDPPSEETTPGDPSGSNILDERYKQDFDGLMFLGYLTDEFVVAGHRFNIRTLNTDAMLEVALGIKKWQSTIAESRVYSTAVVAASIELVDERPLYQPLGVGVKDFDYRFAVVRRWYPWTIDQVYDRCMALELRVNAVLDYMGKASG